MNKWKKRNLFGMCICIILMFAWIILTVFLTGKREISDFTQQDRVIFSAFIIIELITIVAMSVFLFRSCKQTKISGTNVSSVPPTNYERRINRRGIFLLLSSCILSASFVILGIYIQKIFIHQYDYILKIVLSCSLIVALLLFPLNLFLEKRYIGKFNNMMVEELQQFILSHRQTAESTAYKKLKQLKIIRLVSGIYAGVFSIFGVLIAVCAGALTNTDVSVAFCFLSAFFFLTSISRIIFPEGKEYFDDDKTYVQPSEYPILYNLTRKVADTLNCVGEIKISLLPECNAGIAKIGGVYSVQLGVVLLNILTEEELYAILLHEFIHIKSDNSHFFKESHYNDWICSGGNSHFLNELTSILFSYVDAVYNFEYTLYLYSVSVVMETKADSNMIKNTNATVAASALLKTNYYYLFMWESQAWNYDNRYEEENLQQDFLHRHIDLFNTKMKERSEDWNRITKVEILSRTASHPTINMRLEALGVKDYSIINKTAGFKYTSECLKALDYVEKLLYEYTLSTYQEDRTNHYLNPKQKIDEWESNNRPLSASDYSNIVFALRELGRVTDSIDLCDRAISELPKPATYYAKFIKGSYLLHKYDPAGIELIYSAMENNSNYIDEGLDEIGEFCCLAGLKDELEIYRKKNIVFLQKSKDLYSEIGLLRKNDNLSTEHLPDYLKEKILSYINSIEQNTIKKIYLVRKTISNDFFTSAFVVEFDDETEEMQQNIISKIFDFLDTCDDWQFSLFNYADTSGIKFDKIPDSCIYQKK